MVDILIQNKESYLASIEQICKYSSIAVDTETTGLYPFHGDRLFSVIVAVKDKTYYFDFNEGGLDCTLIKDMQKIFDTVKSIFFMNAIYDMSMLYFEGINIDTPNIYDIAVLARIDKSNHSDKGHGEISNLSLDYLAKYYLDKDKDTTVSEYIKEHKLYSKDHMNNRKPLYSKVPIDIMFRYGCVDARLTYDIAYKVYKSILNQQETDKSKAVTGSTLSDMIKQESKLIKIVFDMKKAGLLVDVDFIEKAYEREILIADSTSKLLKLDIGGDFNPNSTKQLSSYFIKEGVELGTTEKGNYIVDKKALNRIEHPMAKRILKMREAYKNADTYYKNYLNLKDIHNVIHCNFNQGATKTSRFSSSAPNLQNIPKEKYHVWAVRNSFIAREDYVLLLLDYKQQEMRCMIDLAEEDEVIERILEGEDFYTATRDTIEDMTEGLELTRDDAKTICLAIAYGFGNASLAAKLKCSPEMASNIRKSFYKALPNLARLQHWVESYAKDHGHIYTQYGRKIIIDEGYEYKSLNALIQGTCAGMTKKAMLENGKLLKNYKSRLVLTVHDEIVVELHKSESFLAQKIIDNMINVYKYKKLPMGVDISVSHTSWAKKQKLSNIERLEEIL